MKTFFNILQELIGYNPKKYPDDCFEFKPISILNYPEEQIHIIFLINNIYFHYKESNAIDGLLYQKSYAKFTALNSILDNSFYNNELKERIFDTFFKAQRCYHGFARLANIWRVKHNKLIVEHDLVMNPLDINNKNTFLLVENNSNYLFNINELVNIILTAIGNSPDFFSEPLNPLNPYNNQQLTKANLYNIYFQIKRMNKVIPLLFHSCFLVDFNLQTFSEHFETIIRENAIHKFVFNTPHNILNQHVRYMLSQNRYTKQLTIDSEFPSDLLVNIFRPYLFLHFMSKYFIKGTTKRYNSKLMLNYKLKKFYEYNQSFGRKTFRLNIQTNKILVHLNDDHISFYNINISESPFSMVSTDTDTDSDMDI